MNDDALLMPSVLLSQCLWRALERALCCASNPVLSARRNPVLLPLSIRPAALLTLTALQSLTTRIYEELHLTHLTDAFI